MGSALPAILALIRERPKTFYVYVLRRPNGEPFYVGKGRYDRIAMHERYAGKTTMRGYRLSIIRQALRDGLQIGYELTGFFDDESQAFAEERRLISLYGRFDLGEGSLTNNTDGGEGGSNPSAATLAKRIPKLKAKMADPEYRAAAVACLRSAEEKRKANALIAMQSHSFRERSSERFKELWADPEFRTKTTEASKKAQSTDEYKASHAKGVARTHATPEFHAKRNAGRRKPEVIAKCAAIAADPERRARQRESAKLQRAIAEQHRRDVVSLADEYGAIVNWPISTSSSRTWLAIRSRLMSGERNIDADPLRSRERQSTAAKITCAANKSASRSEETRLKMSASAKARFARDGTEYLRKAGQAGAASRWGGQL